MNTLYKDSKSTSRSCYGIASLRFPWPKMLNEVWGGGGGGGKCEEQYSPRPLNNPN